MAKQQKRPDRLDTATGSERLTDNPFASLGAANPVVAPPQEPAQEPPKVERASGFRVERTRKGGLPIFLEKRPGGKSVTVIRNISGNLDDVLTRLKKLCGAGGTVREEAVEIQGDHRDRIEAFLKDHAGK